MIRKLIIFPFAIFILILIVGCSRSEEVMAKNRKLDVPLTFSDSIWIKFSESMERKDIAYLVKNSLDTIECTDCLTNNENMDMVESRLIYENYLENLMHLDSLSKKEFSTGIYDDRLIVNYFIKSRYAEEGGYNLIYEFQKEEDDFLFEKMYFVP